MYRPFIMVVILLLIGIAGFNYFVNRYQDLQQDMFTRRIDIIEKALKGE